MLVRIGALATATMKGKTTKLVKISTLLAAMRLHGYEYAGGDLNNNKMKGIDFRQLDLKSSRILNRLTRLAVTY